MMKFKKNVFRCASENGIRFNLDKCKLKFKEIKFLGHVFFDKGLKPDFYEVT